MSSHSEKKQTQAGQVTGHQRPLCPHLYTDLSPQTARQTMCFCHRCLVSHHYLVAAVNIHHDANFKVQNHLLDLHTLMFVYK